MPPLLIPSNTGQPLSLEEVNAICHEVRQGRPRRYIETFLKIQDENSKLIPLKFVSNQDYFYNETFGKHNALQDGFWAFVAKDRKARSSTFWGACLFAFMMNIPSFHAVIIGALEEHAEVALRMMDVFYNNLPDTMDSYGFSLMKPVQTHWDKSFREVGFGPTLLIDGKPEKVIRVNSSVTISTSRTPAAGRGGTPRFLWFIERAHNDQTFEPQLMPSLLDSAPKNAIRVDDTTPFGIKNGYYKDFQSIKNGEVNAIYLLRRWFDNSVNAMAPEDSFVLPADRRELTATGVLQLTDEEKNLAKLFPDDGISHLSRILWRRWKIKQAVDISLGDPSRGRALFLQEHLENDSDCWMDLANPSFDVLMLRRMIDNAKEPLPEEKIREANLSTMPVPGMRFRAWQLPYSGGRYYGGMDLGTGRQYSDASVLEIFDARTGMYVAEMYGRAGLIRSVTASADIMRAYNIGLFGPETNGLGEGAIEALRQYGYPNIYYRESGQKASISTLRERQYGWYTTSHNRPQMFLDFQEAISKGMIDVPNRELVQEIQTWNPDPSSDEHAGDRVMAAMIAYQMAKEAHRFPAYNAKAPMASQSPIRVYMPPAYSPWLGGR